MSSDGYNHFILNPTDLTVGGRSAPTPAAASQSAIQRLLGGAPELLDRISEQAAEMSFLDPLNIDHADMKKLYHNRHDPWLRANDHPIRWWSTHGQFAYRSMLDSISDKLDNFRIHVAKARRGMVPEIAEVVHDLRVFNDTLQNRYNHLGEHVKTYYNLHKLWKELRDKMVVLLNDNRMSHARMMGNWIIKSIDDTFAIMRGLLLSMEGTHETDAPFTKKYAGKRDLTKRILKGQS